MLCNVCLNKVQWENDEDEDRVKKCPECRKTFALEDVETIQYTASSQWDVLLNIAARFAKMDHRGTQDTSDEEASDRFIDDEQSELTLVLMLFMRTLYTERPFPHRSLKSEPESQDGYDSEPNHESTGNDPPSTPDPHPWVTGPSQTPRKRRIIGTPEASSDIEVNRDQPDGSPPDAGPSTIPHTPMRQRNVLSFADSPRVEKEKRLKALAEERERKKQRR